jgi:hypothetical protein
MNALVVYETLWGNTAQVARAIAEGLGEDARAVTVKEAARESVDVADLLVVGGPTHAKGMSRGGTYFVATRLIGDNQGERADTSSGRVASFLKSLPKDAGKAAAFDTRGKGEPGEEDKIGGAAPKIADRLADKGYDVLADPEGFLVEDTAGPLVEGELERARAWGARLAAARDAGATG